MEPAPSQAGAAGRSAGEPAAATAGGNAVCADHFTPGLHTVYRLPGTQSHLSCLERSGVCRSGGQPRLPTPERYDGSPWGCRSFLTQCQLIFDLQPQTFPTDAAHVAYIVTQLTGRARRWGTAMWQADRPCLWTSGEFMAEMQRSVRPLCHRPGGRSRAAASPPGPDHHVWFRPSISRCWPPTAAGRDGPWWMPSSMVWRSRSSMSSWHGTCPTTWSGSLPRPSTLTRAWRTGDVRCKQDHRLRDAPPHVTDHLPHPGYPGVKSIATHHHPPEASLRPWWWTALGSHARSASAACGRGHASAVERGVISRRSVR